MLNEYEEMFAEFGGELLTFDTETHTATIGFDKSSDMDTFMGLVNGNLVVPLLGDFTTDVVNGRSILTIVSRLGE